MLLTEMKLADFLRKLIVFDNNSQSVINKAIKTLNNLDAIEEHEWSMIRVDAENIGKENTSTIRSIISEYKLRADKTLSQSIRSNKAVFERLYKCKEILSSIPNTEESILKRALYLELGQNSSLPSDLSVTEILDGKIDYVSQAYEIDQALKNTTNAANNNAIKNLCASFYGLCRKSEELLNQEIATLRKTILKNTDLLHDQYGEIWNESLVDISDNLQKADKNLNKYISYYAARKQQSRMEAEKCYHAFSCNGGEFRRQLEELENRFLKEFPPEEYEKEYLKIYSNEPSYEEFECKNEMPQGIRIGSLGVELTPFKLSEYTLSFLNKYYPFMSKKDRVIIPHGESFGSEFNYLFRFESNARQMAVKDACDLGMRLFMMLPPGKVNFTFIDPVTLGESFAIFTRLVDIDDRSSEIINGKIWTSPLDIEEKLKIMTDHISNVTQRCLQGKYENIYEYNQVAEQNAEAYKILMLMDYPSGLTDQSLRLLEQIVTSGPKCGVFTIIYRNESQYKKISERTVPLITNIETGFRKFDYSDKGTRITYGEETVNGEPIIWQGIPLPGQKQMDGIIATLKKGIKNADKVVIGIEKVSDAEATSSTKEGIRIPIGIHGANEVQYLTLGVGGSHHALIAGVAGSGKSSLLHTIILRALTQYSPEELSIYLVDFKRGVEFKIYADFVLPTFKVVAIESEREFGYNILSALEREQKIRADKFKKSHVDKIEEYRELGKKMPRVLVIMDEFHELFSNANDEFAKKSAVIMERIVRQGRAFGVHLILASQSYSNITGIDRAVFDQMAVRIVLKCSKADANLLLDNGSSEIDQISIDDPGRAVYNSEAGNKEYNSHFRVAYIDPSKHRSMLREISDSTRSFADPEHPTRILLTNIEDNNYSIFKQFPNYDAARYTTPGRLYIGEPLSVNNNMAMDLERKENSNLLMIGGDTDKARSMFTFALLSLCINYWIANRMAPEKPFITLFNCKPLEDSYFKDTLKVLAELLPQYTQYITCGDMNIVQTSVARLYDYVTGTEQIGNQDQYFLVFGYQRAEELKSETKLTPAEDIDSLFNIMPLEVNKPQLSVKEMFSSIVKGGAQKGVHTLLWQDSFNALYQDDKDMMSFFSMRIAFDMSQEEYSRFVGANDVSMMSENNAIYYNRVRDNQKFRPYQSPDDEWLEMVCKKLK